MRLNGPIDAKITNTFTNLLNRKTTKDRVNSNLALMNKLINFESFYYYTLLISTNTSDFEAFLNTFAQFTTLWFIPANDVSQSSERTDICVPKPIHLLIQIYSCIGMTRFSSSSNNFSGSNGSLIQFQTKENGIFIPQKTSRIDKKIIIN